MAPYALLLDSAGTRRAEECTLKCSAEAQQIREGEKEREKEKESDKERERRTLCRLLFFSNSR